MKLFFDMAIVDEHGRTHGRLRIEIPEDAAYMGNRIVDDIQAGFGIVSFDQAVRVMRVKEFRRDLLRRAATQCGDALADHLEDREGWHGAERQERVERAYNLADLPGTLPRLRTRRDLEGEASP